LSGCAETALKPVVLDKGSLHGIEASVVFETFDGSDELTVVHHREGHAGQNPTSFNQDGTRSAFATVARFFGTSHATLVT
jgi:hypothetical protein